MAKRKQPEPITEEDFKVVAAEGIRAPESASAEVTMKSSVDAVNAGSHAVEALPVKEERPSKPLTTSGSVSANDPEAGPF